MGGHVGGPCPLSAPVVLILSRPVRACVVHSSVIATPYGQGVVVSPIRDDDVVELHLGWGICYFHVPAVVVPDGDGGSGGVGAGAGAGAGPTRAATGSATVATAAAATRGRRASWRQKLVTFGKRITKSTHASTPGGRSGAGGGFPPGCVERGSGSSVSLVRTCVCVCVPVCLSLVT